MPFTQYNQVYLHGKLEAPIRQNKQQQQQQKEHKDI